MDVKGSLSPRRQNEIAPIKTIDIAKGAPEAFLRFFISATDGSLRADIMAHIFVQYLLAQIDLKFILSSCCILSVHKKYVDIEIKSVYLAYC